ncbi:MAG: hypothetical protein ACRBDL_07260 [Alphaproteobacteria bacterium]
MNKLSLLTSYALALSLNAAQAEPLGDDAKTFSFEVEDGQKIVVPCGKLSSDGSLTAEFLTSLDSSIHGSDGVNLFEMSSEERNEYIDRQYRFAPEVIRKSVLAPYKKYDQLGSDEEKMDFVISELERHGHGMNEKTIEQLRQTCLMLN